MKICKNIQSGRSMVEMLGVLAIIGVLSVGGIAGYSKAMNKYKINQMLDTVSQVIAKMVEVDGKNVKNGEINPSNSAKALGFDCEFDEAQSRCKVPFGLYYYNLGTISDDMFMVQFDGSMAQEACVALLSSEFYKNTPDDWWYPSGYILVYSSEHNVFYGKSEEALSHGAKTEVTAADIARACHTCGDMDDGYEPSCRIMLYIRNGYFYS